MPVTIFAEETTCVSCLGHKVYLFFLHLLFEKKSNVKSPTVKQHYTLYISAKEVTNQTLKRCHILFSKIVKAFATGSASNACEQSSAQINFQALENLIVLVREE